MGHNLTRLWAAAKMQGIDLQPPHAFYSLIKNLARGHEKYQFRNAEEFFSHSGPNWAPRDVGHLADAVGAEVQNAEKVAREKLEKDGGPYYIPLSGIYMSVDIEHPSSTRRS